MPALPETPFFIVGHPRSGTTLLRFILSSHSRLHIPAETGFLPYLGVNPARLLKLADVEQLLDRIASLNTEWAGLVPDLEKFYAALPEPCLAHLLDALYHTQITPTGAARWGDKTPGYIYHLPALYRIFPQAQFLHVIRDGRDVVLSASKKWGAARWYMDEYYLLKNWVKAVELGHAFGQELNAQSYLEVRYDDLVRQPEATIKAVCLFLAEEFQPAMLDHTNLAQELVGPGGHTEVLQPVHKTSVGRWQSEMSPFVLKMSARVAGPTLVEFDYPSPDEMEMTLHEKFRFARLAIKFQLSDFLRRSLTALGWLTLNRGKRRGKTTQNRPSPQS